MIIFQRCSCGPLLTYYCVFIILIFLLCAFMFRRAPRDDEWDYLMAFVIFLWTHERLAYTLFVTRAHWWSTCSALSLCRVFFTCTFREWCCKMSRWGFFALNPFNNAAPTGIIRVRIQWLASLYNRLTTARANKSVCRDWVQAYLV